MMNGAALLFLQCVMCNRTAAAQQWARAQVLNGGIVVLLIPPVVILGGIIVAGGPQASRLSRSVSQKPSQECNPLRHKVQEQAFVRGMRAFPDCT